VAAWALVLWTLFVWGTRIVNILTDGAGAGALVVATALTALAVAAGLSLARVRRLPWAVPALAAATVAVWAVRVPLLLGHDHEAAFVVVHLVLAGVSVALAALALRATPPRRRSQATPPARPSARP
jgi:cytochrome bd-type quinol oxidase subunit 1